MLKIFTILWLIIDICLWVCYDNINQARRGLGGKKKTPSKSVSSVKSPFSFTFLFYHKHKLMSTNEEITGGKTNELDDCKSYFI